MMAPPQHLLLTAGLLLVLAGGVAAPVHAQTAASVDALVQDLASEKVATSTAAMEALLARGAEARGALEAHVAEYPVTHQTWRSSRRQWYASRRAQRILRLLDERAAAQNADFDVPMTQIRRFATVAGLEPEAAQAAYREMIYPNRKLLGLLPDVEAALANGLDKATTATLRERFAEALADVEERYRQGASLDFAADPSDKLQPWSEMVQGEILTLLYARVVAPDAWTLGWWNRASVSLPEPRERVPGKRIGRLELTLRLTTPKAAAIRELVRKAALKAETVEGRRSSLRIALGSRMRELATELAIRTIENDLAELRQRRKDLPDRLSGERIGVLRREDGRMVVDTETILTPGTRLAAERNGEFVSWLLVRNKLGTLRRENMVTWSDKWAEKDVREGDTARTVPADALLPDDVRTYDDTLFLAAHTLYSYGETEQHAELLRRMLDEEGTIRMINGEPYRWRNMAMAGILRIKDKPAGLYQEDTQRGLCPYAGPVDTPVFGDGGKWDFLRNRVEEWFDRPDQPEEPVEPEPEPEPVPEEEPTTVASAPDEPMPEPEPPDTEEAPVTTPTAEPAPQPADAPPEETVDRGARTDQPADTPGQDRTGILLAVVVICALGGAAVIAMRA